MGFLPDMESEPGAELKFLEGTILTLAQLDAFIATTVTGLRNDSTNKVGAITRSFIVTFLPKAYFQLVGTIQSFF